ncbi:MAG: glycosyltransferase family 4 protein [Bulleidia sp.]|nr:glycosyltransferase family 4 protein [Bulleidia sp.]
MTEKKPKILYVAENMSGGVFTYLVDLTDRLIDKYDIVIAYAPDSETPKDPRNYFDDRIPLYQIPTWLHAVDPIKEPDARAALKNLVVKEQPDLIHLNGYKAGKIGRAALDGMGLPLFYTPHGYMFHSEDHNVLSRSVYRYYEQQSAAKANCVTIACSKGEYAETLGFTTDAAFVNNGIDTEELDRIVKETAPADHPFTVFTSGRINDQKNPDLFNEIAKAMPQVKFVWIGDGINKYKLTSSNIEVTGWLDREDALKRALNSDVFILTSRWEGMPMTLLEAMYLKKLCIVTNVVGSRDVVTNGENGFVASSAAAFVNAINHSGDEIAQTMVENAYKDVAENYTLDHMAKGYDAIYQKALKK